MFASKSAAIIFATMCCFTQPSRAQGQCQDAKDCAPLQRNAPPDITTAEGIEAYADKVFPLASAAGDIGEEARRERKEFVAEQMKILESRKIDVK